MDYKKFTGKEGKLISAKKALEFTEPYQKREREIVARGENFVKAEFFGIHTFNQLIKMHEERCVGFRVYYGLSDEKDESETGLLNAIKGKKKPTSRLFIVPVDADGNDLTTTAQLGGMKDMPPAAEVMRGGPLCPSQC